MRGRCTCRFARSVTKGFLWHPQTTGANRFSGVIINLCTCPPDSQGISHTASVCFTVEFLKVLFYVLHCVAKVRWKFQTVFGVWYTLQTYINITRNSGPCHYLVYANNGRDSRLAKIFLGANDVRQHSPGGPRFISFWGRVGVFNFRSSQFVPMKFC